MKTPLAWSALVCAGMVLGTSLLAGAAGPLHAPSTPSDQPAEDVMHPGLSFQTIQIGNTSVKYAVYIPRDLDLSKPQPAIVFLNGRGECGSDGVRQCSVGLIPAVLSQPDKWPFIIIAPQKPDFDAMWDAYSDHVLGALDRTAKQVKIDPDRVYLTGLSQGGYGTWRIAANNPDRFAAIAPICGWGDPAFIGPRLASMPIWAFHGLKDRIVVPEKSRELVKAVTDARPPANSDVPAPKLTEYPDADHNSWDNAYRKEDLGKWFLSFTRRKAK